MPFYYEVRIPAIETGEQQQSFVFVKWLTQEKSYIKPGTALALIRSGHTQYVLRNAGEGFFTPWKVREGDTIAPDQAVGKITTDGELIPYGRAYFILDVVPPDQS